MENTKALEVARDDEVYKDGFNDGFGEAKSTEAATIKHLRTQLAERDAQLAAERAMADLLAGTLEFVSAHTQVDAAQKFDRLEKYYAHQATRQPTQDKGGE